MNKIYVLLSGMAVLLGGALSTNAQQVLDVNQVSTVVRPNNSLFWDQQQSPSYEVPKGSGKNSLFLGNLWFIGKNVATDSLHGFADRYHVNGSDTYAGPLKTDGSASTDMATVLNFGRVWKVTHTDIAALQQAYLTGTLSSGLYVPPADVAQWPANGPSGYAATLAPFYDANGDNLYNILDGDYPLIKGEEMTYWVLNDTYGNHYESGAAPMGAEIRIALYACKNLDAVGNDDIVNYTTFLEYEIINRSQRTYKDVYAGFNTDIDIGFAYDDFVGCHVDADAFYAYNGDGYDNQDYGYDWPVQSIQFLEGKQTAGRTLSSFISYVNGNGPNGDPGVGQTSAFYNLITGYGNGVPYGNTNMLTHYMFPGASDPTHVGTGGVDPGFNWWQFGLCDTCLSTPAFDQRAVGATGPFQLAPNGSVKVVLGLITTFDSTLSMVGRIEKNRVQNKMLKQWYTDNAMPCVYSNLGEEESVAPSRLVLYPNPATSTARIEGGKINANTRYVLTDVNGKTWLSGKAQQEGWLSLDLENLAAGVYFVKLTEDNGTNHTIKLMKQ